MGRFQLGQIDPVLFQGGFNLGTNETIPPIATKADRARQFSPLDHAVNRVVTTTDQHGQTFTLNEYVISHHALLLLIALWRLQRFTQGNDPLLL
jgi:hypothetical protein